jgi:hypothetical protein
MLNFLQKTCFIWILITGISAHGATHAQRRIGIYHWGGERTQSMAEGIDKIAGLGASVARVAYSPRYYSDYGIGTECYKGFTLTRLAQEPDVARSLDDSRIRVLMLTAYDGMTFGDCYNHWYLTPAFFTPENIEALKREYRDFVLYLCRRYRDTGRRFIISNWEGDNAIYCGAVYTYAVDEVFRSACDRNYRLYYSGNNSPDESLKGLSLWLKAREEAIREGMEFSKQMGHTGVEVIHAPEICVVRFLEQYGLKSVLQSLLTSIRPEYISYSSYESLNEENPAEAFVEALEFIRSSTGTSNIIVGEAGYSWAKWGEHGVRRLEAVINRTLDWGVPWFICWNLNNHGAHSDYGLFDKSDLLTASGRLIHRVLQ